MNANDSNDSIVALKVSTPFSQEVERREAAKEYMLKAVRDIAHLSGRAAIEEILTAAVNKSDMEEPTRETIVVYGQSNPLLRKQYTSLTQQ